MSDDRSWRNRYYGRRSVASRLGLVEAPKRETPSHELVAARELEQREIERMRAIDERLDAETRALWRQRRVDELRALIAEFGAEAVTRISRRVDPKFELPPELLTDEDEEP